MDEMVVVLTGVTESVPSDTRVVVDSVDNKLVVPILIEHGF